MEVYPVYKMLGKDIPGYFDKIYYSIPMEDFNLFVGNFIIEGNSYRLELEDKIIEEKIKYALSVEPKNHLFLLMGRKFVDEKGTTYAEIEEPFSVEHENFPFALYRFLESLGYTTSFKRWDLQMIKVNSKEEAERLIKEWEQEEQQPQRKAA